MPRRSHHIAAMTPAEFESVVRAHPGLQAKVIAAARAVLVDGKSITAAAEPQGFSKQRLAKALDRLNPATLPEGWVRRWVALPLDSMDRVIDMERAAREQLRGGRIPKKTTTKQAAKSK